MFERIAQNLTELQQVLPGQTDTPMAVILTDAPCKVRPRIDTGRGYDGAKSAGAPRRGHAEPLIERGRHARQRTEVGTGGRALLTGARNYGLNR